MSESAKKPTPKEWRDYRYEESYRISAGARVLGDGRTAIFVRLGRAKRPVCEGWHVVGPGRRATVEEALGACLDALRTGVDGAVEVRDE